MGFVCCIPRQRIPNTLPPCATKKIMVNVMIDHLYLRIFRQFHGVFLVKGCHQFQVGSRIEFQSSFHPDEGG